MILENRFLTVAIPQPTWDQKSFVTPSNCIAKASAFEMMICFSPENANFGLDPAFVAVRNSVVNLERDNVEDSTHRQKDSHSMIHDSR